MTRESDSVSQHPSSSRIGFRWVVLGVALSAVTLLVYAGDPNTPNATQPGVTYPIQSAFENPGTCQSCHGDYDVDNDLEPFDMWAGSMMANAGRDPVFWAALDVANNDLPGVGSYCLRCHAPKAWLEERANAGAGGTVGDADGCGLIGNIDEPAANDFEGVTCHLCHRMMVNESPPPGESGVYTENAQYWIDDEICANGDGTPDEPCRRGPYDYLPGQTPAPHEWAYSEYHTQSMFCGNCHNVTSPVNTLIDSAGSDTGVPYPIERTFSEWQQSDYAIDMGADFQSCQDCHMPDPGVKGQFACVFPFNDRTNDMAGHDFVGGNTWVPGLIRDQYGTTLDLGDAFNNTIARAEALLEGAGEVEIFAPTTIVPGSDLNFDVRVTNLSGHKLPTGYNEGRRMWIHVEVLEADSNVVWESGAYDVATGVLTRDAQAKVYESRRGIWNSLGTGECDTTNAGGVEEFHFVLDDCIALDNRIPPKGFTGGANIETQPVGYSYPETSPGSGVTVNHDDTSYVVSIPPGAQSPLSIRATLKYQTSSKDYIEFLRDEAVNENFPDDCISRTPGWTWPAGLDVGERSRGEFLYALWENSNKSAPFDMTTATEGVVIDPTLFEDGFETGNLSAWDNMVP